MTREALKDTPLLGRKSTFKPLVAKSHCSEAQEALKNVKVSPALDEDPPVAVKSIDACLKLGPTASVSISNPILCICIPSLMQIPLQKELFGKSQAALVKVQAIIKRQPLSTDPDDMLGENDIQVLYI